MKEAIKVNFCDYHSGFNNKDNGTLSFLRKHFDVELSDEPDFLFCSVFGNKHFEYENCVKIFYTGEDIVPNFNIYDYAMGFDFIEFEDRYLRFPLYFISCGGTTDIVLPNMKEKSNKELLNRKFCNFIYTNGAAQKRIDLFHLLSKHKRVDSGGRFMNNVGGPCENKLAFQSLYKFSIAFENFESNGYTTEKIVDAFKARTIPIYWGNPRVAEELNPKAFINYYDYGSLEKVAERVIEIDNNDELYLQILNEPIFYDNKFAYDLSSEKLEKFLLNIIQKGKNTRRVKRKFYWKNEDYNKNWLRVKRFFKNLKKSK